MNDLINNFINSNSKHHQILYNNKIVIIENYMNMYKTFIYKIINSNFK